MKVRVRLVVESDDGRVQSVDDVACVERTGLTPATLGLTLVEAKGFLERAQQHMVTHQVSEYLAAVRRCPECGRARSLNGHHRIVLRTVFGKLALSSERLKRCSCEQANQCSFSPLAALFPERTAPELLYLQTKWASLMSYGMTVELLSEVLPVASDISVSSVQRQLHRVAERMDAELGDEVDIGPPYHRDIARLPRPDAPLTVGIDGGYVHARDGENRKAGWFEVIAGKSVSDKRPSKCFAFVNRYDTKPRRRLTATLESQGLQPNQQVTFVSDGGDTVRALQYHISPHAEHLLDWFHVTMRITALRQMAKGLVADDIPDLAKQADEELERVKWYLWHGNVYKALVWTEVAMGSADSAADSVGREKLAKALSDFYNYILNNRETIPNYGDRYRNGERIASGFVESTVNQVVSKRFVKKQQMRWTERGAHLLLQTRTATLNDELRPTFDRWYPDMKQAA